MNICLSKIFSKSCLSKVYYNKPCKHGHGNQRYVSNGMCVVCRKERFNKWRQDNPEKMKSAKLKWYEENKEHSFLVAKKWKEKNLDRYKEKKKEWVINNKDKKYTHDKTYANKNKIKIAEYKRVWREKNIDRLKIAAKEKYEKNKQDYFCYSRNRRSKKIKNGGVHTPEEIILLLEKQNHKCVNCKCKLTKQNRHLDHIMPISKGGTNDIKNLQWLCQRCNLSKSAKDPIEWARKNGRLL